jgi:hypothetical protein
VKQKEKIMQQIYGWNISPKPQKENFDNSYSYNGPFPSIQAAKDNAISKTQGHSIEIFELIPMSTAEHAQEIFCANDLVDFINCFSIDYGWNLNLSIPQESTKNANLDLQSFLKSWTTKYVTGKTDFKPGRIVERFLV